jgi:2,4-dienoyl-CoA reductase-like NADH-dependent reductase (Old Yellow Enzyme family)/glyoxylase-like metal-dependent hydrolase (beta-lactamase superfamily II)
MPTFLIFLNFLFLLVSGQLVTQKNLFDETNLKYLKLKNRIFRGSVGDLSFKDGKISEEGFKLYDDFSKNEIGTIFTGYTTVSDYNQFDNVDVFRIDKDEYIPEFKKLVDLVHKNGANIFMQLVHIGMNTKTNAEIVYAPSSLPIPNQNRFSKEMTKEDILRIENDFAEAALRAKKAGFDGVEIHGAHYYLISEFLSPLFNKRTDEYGGSDENRARFLLEIIAKVREKVGKEYIVGLKINSEDGDKNGITEEGFMKACLLAEAAGIDFIQVTGMRWFKERIKNPIFADISAKLAEKVKIPVMVIGGARNLDEINEILNKSKIQYFGFARPFICEYDLAKKWKAGQTKKAKCVSCNSCLNKHFGICIFNKNKCDMKSAEPADLQSIKMGEYKVTYLPDGEGYTIPSFSYHGSTEEDWKKLKQYLNKEGKSLMSIGSFLIEYKNEKILFDLGIGNIHYSQPEGYGDGGELLNNLKKAGLDRKDITKVIYSHFHPDHIGWTSIEENGKRFLTFPNADYYSSKNEWDFWKDNIDHPLAIDQKSFREPLEGKIKFLKDGEEIIPNLFVKFEFGHTPGLINLILNADGKRMWFMSDIVHSDLQFENPEWCFFTDNNEERAIKTRKNAFDELSQPNTIIANSHFVEEAFGYLKKEGEGKYKFKRFTK